MKLIDVTCAILVENGKILACQRKFNTDHPLKWELPGGKIETGETKTACIQREIVEELGVNVKVLTELTALNYDYGFKKIRLIPFVCEITSGILEAHEHESIKWLALNELKEVDWAEADRLLLKTNLKELKCWL
ncbi:MAG: (deoxy)nucleoside triphosphate pyrophosphohydrolase [Prolixibacteraceae bacterium]|nr:(deoxy)nucleoside triphosphate pyrophosphohydrolase [Prolixibacteraceae bacterium]